MKTRFMLSILVCALSVGLPASAQKHYAKPAGGLLILAEQRFDPAVQRLLATEDLAAMPLANGRLFIIVPTRDRAVLEQAQIRSLERLLAKPPASPSK
ncbi:MAG: hypothetical protein NXH85_01960 [Pseudomonadaceae bacterium]|nr:hypothetical protein [Pseudomonadaceae bacterium]